MKKELFIQMMVAANSAYYEAVALYKLEKNELAKIQMYKAYRLDLVIMELVQGDEELETFVKWKRWENQETLDYQYEIEFLTLFGQMIGG